MKHLNGKQKDKTNQKRKKTSQKPGFSNSGKGYQIMYMNLRSRCIVKNKTSIIKREMRTYQVKNIQSTLNSFPPEYKSTERYTGLNTFKNKAVTFFFENGEYEISVEDLIGNQKRGSLSVDFFSYKNSNEGDSSLWVVLKPRPSDIDLQVQANDQNLELHESENQDSAQKSKFFILHSPVSGYVSFECTYRQGLYIGVRENHLTLMEKKEDDEAFLFRLTQ
ncbi:interleukin-33 [Notamacropus eugenii]|uniref:interleukin-33 n=1 Tax=Notamacropus eugenii TaxID=9315 RepID=UPI003B67009B